MVWDRDAAFDVDVASMPKITNVLTPNARGAVILLSI